MCRDRPARRPDQEGLLAGVQPPPAADRVAMCA
jgi:hypothetical protein